MAAKDKVTADQAEERSPADGLTAGRVVHYVLGSEGPGHVNAGQCRPAMVVRVWGHPPVAAYPIQLQVFLDGTNDDPVDGAGLSWRTSVPYSPGNATGTWHWPERE